MSLDDIGVSMKIGPKTRFIISTSGRLSSLIRYKKLLQDILKLDIAYISISSHENSYIQPQEFVNTLRGMNCIGGAISKDIKHNLFVKDVNKHKSNKEKEKDNNTAPPAPIRPSTAGAVRAFRNHIFPIDDQQDRIAPIAINLKSEFSKDHQVPTNSKKQSKPFYICLLCILFSIIINL